MVIRFKKYRNPAGDEVKALKLSEKNVEEVVAYMTKNGWKAKDETQVYQSEDLKKVLKDGQFTSVKLELDVKYRDSMGRPRKAPRKAHAGDFIVRQEVPSKETGTLVYEFTRIKAADFEHYKLV